ncbi:MAG: MFS transporter [Clostridia bacterium]|nr:MFS transporter [Clostridia bacterium]
MLRKSFKATIGASCIGYFTQAVLINFAPLLFITFQKEFGLSIAQLSVLIATNFATELIIDFLGTKYVSKIGYRRSVIIAQALSVMGLVMIPMLPKLLPHKFLALEIAMIFCGLGGGLIEVLISPIVGACPTKKKSAIMSVLHSFYCWGQMGVVLLSTLYFRTVGIENWEYLSLIWAIIPAVDLVLFCFVPINTLVDESEESSFGDLIKQKLFWVFLVMMLCAGATELSMSQWASAFAEAGLGVEKWIGDLLGPCLFAVCMGGARVFYATHSDKIGLKKGILISAFICIFSYLVAIFSPIPIISLLGCALCGVGSGMLWPGTYSIATNRMPKGGVPMFGLLALAGDLGCLSGPYLTGMMSTAFGGNLKMGFLCSLVFPVTLVIMVLILMRYFKKPTNN